MSESLKAAADLIKYKLSAAVTFSGITGYFILKPEPGTDLIFLTAGLFLTAGGSAALNQYSEGNYDRLMQRTKDRPIPAKKLAGKQALGITFAALLSGLSLLFLNGLLPFTLGLITIFLYNFVYTKLKRVSPAALIPGSLVGAIPPLIGYVSAGGTIPGPGILLFSSFMFLWQIPHFWLIGLRYSDDYRKAGFRFNEFFINSRQAKVVVFVWIVLSTLLLLGISISGLLFQKPLFFIIIPLNLVFILLFHAFLFGAENERNSRSAFILINSFSLIVMLLFIINAFL